MGSRGNLLIFIAVLASAARLPAGTIETHPFAGVTLYSITQTTPRPNNIELVKIDLTNPGIVFKLTPPDLNLPNGDETMTQTTRQFVTQQRAQIGINASFFRLDNAGQSLPTNNIGLLASQGHRVSPWDFTGEVGINITSGNIASLVTAPAARASGFELSPQTYPLYNAVAGSDLLLNAGINVAPPDSTDPGNFYNLNPRTAIGLTRTHELLLMTVDGRQGGFSEGMYLREVAAVLHNYGGWQAINLDGGGSTQMVMDYYGDNLGPQLVNHPQGERYVGSSLAVYAAPYVVPEPAASGLLAMGAFLCAGRRRRV